MAIGTVAAFAGSATAQPVVVTGTGDPNIDVPAVQAAVDQGGRVVLRGQFSFDRPPAAPPGASYSRMVTVSKNVVISGWRDENGGMTTIERGEWPFIVDAVNSHVTIEGLRFVRPRAGASWVLAAAGLTVTSCRVESMETSAELGMQAGLTVAAAVAIQVTADPHPVTAANPGIPENFSGTLAVLDNDIDAGGPPGALGIGVLVFSVGRSPDKEVDVYVSGNNIRNVTEPAIEFRVVGGRVHVERNVIVTGDVIGGSANPDAIRVTGSGSYLVAHNSIDCGWVDGAATGINVFGNGFSPAANAIIVDNDVTMSAPEGTVFGANSAGIEIRQNAQGNSVLNNRIRGRASAALSVIRQNSTPGSSSFVSNDLDGFQSSLADIFVDAGATNTIVIGRKASVADHGSGTVVIPMP